MFNYVSLLFELVLPADIGTITGIRLSTIVVAASAITSMVDSRSLNQPDIFS